MKLAEREGRPYERPGQEADLAGGVRVLLVEVDRLPVVWRIAGGSSRSPGGAPSASGGA